MKTIISNPKLEIQSSRDGVWLHFETRNGKCASINLPTFFANDRSVRDTAIVQWAVEYAHTNPPAREPLMITAFERGWLDAHRKMPKCNIFDGEEAEEYERGYEA
jgi:hypothetical protein